MEDLNNRFRQYSDLSSKEKFYRSVKLIPLVIVSVFIIGLIFGDLFRGFHTGGFWSLL